MGGNLEKVGSLMECLFDHPVLLQVKVEHSLLEVTDSTMDQLCASTASTR